MKREDVLKSVLLKRTFVEDRNLPISTLDNPYFESRLEALNKMHNSIDAFDTFCETLEGFESEVTYLNYHKGVQRRIFDHLYTLLFTSKADALCHIKQSFANIDDSYAHPHVMLPEDDAAYISIQISPYNSARVFRPELFSGCNSTEEFVSRFTQDKHLISSSGFINSILSRSFGPYIYENLHTLMASTYRVIADKLGITNRLCSINSKEILIKVGDNMNFSMNELKECVKSIPVVGEFFAVDIFECFTINGTDGYIRNYYSDDRYEICNVDDSIFAQVEQYINCDPIIEDDLVFYDPITERLVRFLEPIKNPLLKDADDNDEFVY